MFMHGCNAIVNLSFFDVTQRHSRVIEKDYVHNLILYIKS